MSYIKNSIPDYDECKACVQEFLDEIMNFQDGSVGIYKIGFITKEFVEELEEADLIVMEYDADFMLLWVDGHMITVEAKYHLVGPDEHEVIWEITE